MSGLLTTVVGSYPQPEWLIDRERLGDRLPPRVRARDLWRVPEPFLEAAYAPATPLGTTIAQASSTSSRISASSIASIRTSTQW